MRSQFRVVVAAVVVVAAGALQGQGALQIRAAAASPVSGWEQMTSRDGTQAVWVAPTNQLTSADIQRAEASTTPDGDPAVSVMFTEDGARKIAALSATQSGKPIAILLDDKLIWAPVVRGGLEREMLLSGGPGGLTRDEIQRLVGAFKGR